MFSHMHSKSKCITTYTRHNKRATTVNEMLLKCESTITETQILLAKFSEKISL